ncbi:RBM39, partial [Cordylochernes scorpioides]
ALLSHSCKTSSILGLSISPLYCRIDMSVEERDLRTVFVMQLANRVRTRDLVQFFSSCGKVNDVKIITDSKTKRSKGIAYIEFEEIESVNHALGLNGKKLLGVPIIVQPSQAEKNRSASGSSLGYLCRPNPGPMRLYVGSLHFNVTEAMLQELFGPFGPIDSIELLKDGETGRSRGYGFINIQRLSMVWCWQFCDAEHAKRAMDHLNGYELSGRPIRVGHVTEKTELLPPSHLDTDELDRNGIDLGPTGRLQLMAKLAEGTGLKIPQAALNALHGPVITPTSLTTPAAATQCLMLSNMFDRYGSKPSSWELEIRNDVIEECRRHGGALHVAVDKDSHGNVYVKCPSINVAVDVVKALHGRWFAGRIISAAFVPVINYHTLFTEAITATTPL